ncbi:MAG: hypothetical protein NTX50_32175 [Candidatus Sumerlaeota bacterium]|nr:hypothetical protein [Candidatus Sumerlaeota bacterium]
MKTHPGDSITQAGTQCMPRAVSLIGPSHCHCIPGREQVKLKSGRWSAAEKFTVHRSKDKKWTP